MSSPPPPPPSSGRLPPPPPRRTLSRPTAATSTPSPVPPPPPPPPHQTSLSWPTLESAPSSANLEGMTFLATADQISSAVHEWSGGVMEAFSGATLDASATVTSPRRTVPLVPLTPPRAPLPPPPQRSVLPLPQSLEPRAPAQAEPSVASPTVVAVPHATAPMPPPFVPQCQFRHKPPGTVLLAPRQERLPILLVASERAHAMAWKNGLRLADLWQGLVANTNATWCLADSASNANASSQLPPFRSVSRTLMLQPEHVQLQFHEVEQCVPLTPHQAGPQLQQAAALQPPDGNLSEELTLLEDQIDNLLSDDGDASVAGDSHAAVAVAEQHEQVVKDAHRLTSPLSIPWLTRYRQALDEGTDFMPHEQLHCPALILTICTTQEDAGTVLETLRALRSPHYLPPSFRNGQFDPEAIRREVLVLHDNVEGPQQFDEANLRSQLQATFGNGANIVRLNSLAPETAAVLATEEQSDLWGGGGSLGTCLTVADRARWRKYTSQLVVSILLPALERRIADLNVVVSDRKKGVKNVFKSLWGGGASRKKDDDTTDTSVPTSSQSLSDGGRGGDDVKYRYDSVESQTRLLADTLFLMRDYDAAYSTYRLIKDDFKQDRNWVYYASVQEMMALSLYMLDPYGRTKDIFSSIENALLSYSRAAVEEQRDAASSSAGRVMAAPVSIRLATRLCLVLISTRHVCSGRNLEVADLLASASSHETALGAAVLLEQSSSHYYKAEMYRKYAFHMLMSGHMFRSAEQDHHAFRCFTCALYIYRESKWDELYNHLRSALATQLFSMNRMVVSLQLYAKLLGCSDGGSVSVKSQQKFVSNLLEICSDHGKKALAGADRMAAPSHLSGSARDAVRKERLDRIVQVVRYTKSASRVLELPHMNLPCIDDSTVTVSADEAAHHRQLNVPSFGQSHVGSPEVWEDLMMLTTSELKAASTRDTFASNKVLSKIGDLDVRRVIAWIDEEKATRSKLERSRQSAKHSDSIPVRAVKEPISIMFTMSNPLGIPIDVCDLQIVAKMTESHGKGVCTNEDAVTIQPLAASNESEKWAFQNSNIEYEIADFCRMSLGASETDSWKSAEDVQPFFVVTKTKLTLEMESRKMVTVNLCPLALGQLEVLGVRYRLFDSVWAYHPFDIKGPLLQNSRANRANRVRGESVLLKSKVEEGMPCLSVDLVPRTPATSTSPVLEDQIGQWILRISNVGTSAGRNVTLKTNLPWINISGESEGREDQEYAATSNCVGPTGTLMYVTMEGPSLATQGQIQPGESIDVPIEIRASGTGKQDFYMLFRYELFSGREQNNPRCRWLKKMFNVPVYPSIRFSATTSPCYNSPVDQVLSLEVANCRTDRPDQLDIKLEKVAIVSRRYTIEPLDGQAASIYVDTLGWQERASYHFTLTSKENSGALVEEYAMQKVDSTAVTSAPLGFLCLERSHSCFEEERILHQMALARAASQGDADNQPRSIASIRRANTVDFAPVVDSKLTATPKATSIEMLSPQKETGDAIHLLCSWSAGNGDIHGVHYIRGLKVKLAENASKTCPIRMTAIHPTALSNDFEAGPAAIPIKITLQNQLAESPVDFEFSIDGADSFDFSGPGKVRIQLKGGENVTIPMEALLFSPGVFNLQTVRLSVDAGSPTPISYSFPAQWMVAVEPL